MGTTLVVGASGQLGGRITRRLLEAGQSVRVLAREGSDVSALMALGAGVTVGDLKDRASLQRAVDGVHRVLTTATSAARGEPDTAETVDRAGNMALVDAAASAGVERFLLVSPQGADPSSPVPFLAAKGDAERHLQASGLPWTVLACDVFMDVWVPMWVLGPIAQGQPVRLLGGSRRRHYFLAVDDVADLAVAAVAADAARDSRLLVGGPQPLSWSDVVAIVEQVHGHRVETVRIPADRPVEGLPETVSGLLLSLETYDSPPPMDAEEARTAYGVELTSLQDWLRAAPH